MLETLALQQERTDADLVALARDGSRSAFAALVERHQAAIYRLAMRMSHNQGDAEEITQETFFLAHRGIGSFQGDARFRTWLYRIAMNQALMLRRATKRRPTQSLEVVMPASADLGIAACSGRGRSSGGDGDNASDELSHTKQLVERAYQALGQLDESLRAALVLRDLEELSAEEAAQVLGISPEAVRQRAHRGRLKLRHELRDLVAPAAAG
jgi:RNA polymerase sigma-70 factor (ECF subfamily)